MQLPLALRPPTPDGNAQFAGSNIGALTSDPDRRSQRERALWPPPPRTGELWPLAPRSRAVLPPFRLGLELRRLVGLSTASGDIESAS